MSCGLKSISKLSQEHISLTPFSCMNVRLAVQLLSDSVAKVIKEYYPEEMHATADLCGNMDRSVNDERFEWLEHSFLKFLSDWKEGIEKRENISKNAKARMFLSAQTYEGIKITVHSVIEATKFLLQSGFEFVLTEKFNQDVLEEYFGRQRSLGRRNDNPSLYQFGYNANTIRMQCSIVPVTGNTEGAHKQKQKVSWYSIDNTKLKKRSNSIIKND
eukprot:gene15486-17064_t